ncbi:MAG: hypothetical protein JW954_02315 [Dehalococcoidaceae bacterium]|nr:hypothetical protein [Dehalococcoidaceae bacterium]
MKTRLTGAIIIIMVFVLQGCSPSTGAGLALEWLDQVSAPAGGQSVANAVAADEYVYVTGYVTSSRADPQLTGAKDIFLQKYDAAGNEIWTKETGTPGDDYAKGISLYAGSIFVGGYTTGALPGQAGSGGTDATIMKFDNQGNLTWARQLGSEENDYVYAVSADSTGVYSGGFTYGALPGHTSRGGPDAFLFRHDLEGNLLWTRQFGTTASDYIYGVSAGPTGVYAAGTSYGVLPGGSGSGEADGFIIKYDSGGNQLWERQFGTAGSDYVNSITVDASGIYAAGITFGSFDGYTNQGRADAFLVKFDFAGNRLWERQFGTAGSEFAWSVACHDEDIYVIGYTAGEFAGTSGANGYDVYVAVFDTAGNYQGTRQTGTSSDDYAKGITAGPSGVFITGSTLGVFPSQNGSSGYNAFTGKLSP